MEKVLGERSVSNSTDLRQVKECILNFHSLVNSIFVRRGQ